MTEAHQRATEIIRHRSRSFSLAARLLPAEIRDDVITLYAFCRTIDDLIDDADDDNRKLRLVEAQRMVDAVYDTATIHDPVLSEFRRIVERHRIPRSYPDALVAGMAMDTHGYFYATQSDLLLYSYRAAGVVGLMMCHVMGVRSERALANAAHLGIGMQLSNICRDVAEDWERGRCYLPADRLAFHGADCFTPPETITPALHRAMIATVRETLELADHYYRSGDRGLPYLSTRCRIAVATAREVYSGIGGAIRRRGCDPLKGRAWVGGTGKLVAATRGLWKALATQPAAGEVKTPSESDVGPMEFVSLRTLR